MKREEVRRMFDAIAPTYDVLNRILSLGIDRVWRRRLLRSLQPVEGWRVLDIACGTGDLLLGLAAGRPRALVGLDLAPEMLRIADRRLQSAGFEADLVQGAAESLPFASTTFDAVTVAFGIRNFEGLSAGLREIHRVLRPGGQLRVLEFSKPRPGWWRSLFAWYSVSVLPNIGRWISGHPDAYSYLPASVATFPDPALLAKILDNAGLRVTSTVPLAGGIATLSIAERPLPDLLAA